MRIKKELTGYEIETLLQRLQEINLRGVKLTYAISKNTEMLEDTYKHFEEAQKPSKEFIEFQKKLNDLKLKYAKKDDKGKPITTQIPQKDGTAITQVHIDGIGDPESEYTKDFEALKQEYKKVISEREKEGKEYQELLEGKTKFEFRPINLEWFPEDVDQFAMDTLRIWLDEEK